MCTVSMVGDRFRDVTWPKIFPENPNPNPIFIPTYIPTITKEQFDELKSEVEELKRLLKNAQELDQKLGQPDCEMDQKVEFLKKVAEAVGVDLSKVFGTPKKTPTKKK